ncbi:CIA30 family protein [Thiomicrospira microaerophila]|uniref:CIA30 family protein n=1 Tax=Thiomicrospira microaerophila TaxID=406020 RepID=UPI00200DFD80|nr:CIA30 family protein [Thiomicrospira microaerophila]UQB41914.1 CIA30 family protein [Thiomicrospira microaerophila]
MHYRLYPVDPSSTESGQAWDYVSDQVMGGQSQGQILQQQEKSGGWVTCLQGEVSLENNGGFIQMQFDLSAIKDISQFDGFYVTWRGLAPAVAAHLKTSELRQPWQSYKNNLFPALDWKNDYWTFSQFAPYRTGIPLNLERLTRFGLLAIGQAGGVNLCVRELGLFKR